MAAARSTLARMRAKLSKGWPTGLTLLTGEDRYHLDAAEREILSVLAPGDSSEFALTVFGDAKVDAAAIDVGLPAIITLDAFGDRHFSGRVRRIAPFVLDREKQARTVDVEVEFTRPEDFKRFSSSVGIGKYSGDIQVRGDTSGFNYTVSMRDEREMAYFYKQIIPQAFILQFPLK